MHSASVSVAANPENYAPDVAQLQALVQEQAQHIAALQRQLDWFRRQIFGQKSERVVAADPAHQLSLGEAIGSPVSAAPERTTAIPAHTRRSQPRNADEGEELKFFDESKVPVQTIVLLHADVEGLSPDQYEIIGEKVTYRIAQRPGSVQVLKYRRPVVKLKAARDATSEPEILCVPAPQGIFPGSRADVSFAAGLLVDKFAWHLPLYRQHQRLAAAHITVSRPWLTQITQQSIALLEPIYEAQFASIRQSRIKAMDETPIKAGRSGHGKMHTGYFWPVYGEQDEVCFPFHSSRAAAVVGKALGLTQAPGSVLLTDGYSAYARYAAQTGVTHAQCWSHARRAVLKAEDLHPALVQGVLDQIRLLYAIEDQIKELDLTGEAKQLHRLTHSKPLVERLFDWIDRQLTQTGLLPSDPLTQGLAYIRERQAALSVFLTDPDVPLDTNHLERTLRPIPLGKKNWLFCWTELGAKHVGIIQSLISTCKLHKIDPYTYLVDVLQRVGEHPAKQVAELTPRQWKALFAANPMRSDIHQFPV